MSRLSNGPASVSELAEPFEMSLRGVLKHVEVLEDAGLVITSKTGRVRTCELQGKRVDDAARWLEDRKSTWERRIDRLERYVTKESK